MPRNRERPRGSQFTSPARLAVLLVCLGAAVCGLLVTRTGLLGDAGGSGPAEGAATWCVPRGLPSLAKVDFEQLSALRTTLPRVGMMIDGRRYAGGIVAPENMWSDDPPTRLREARSVGGMWPAGYEMRWWAHGGDDIVADVLAFSTSSQAQSFFTRATGVGCHRDGARRRALWAPHARNLVWVNPDDFVEHDAFLLRGRLVYRVVAVLPTQGVEERSLRAERVGTYAVDVLACTLPEADCGGLRGGRRVLVAAPSEASVA